MDLFCKRVLAFFFFLAVGAHCKRRFPRHGVVVVKGQL